MGIQINGQTDTVASTTSGGSVTLTSATLPAVSNISATRVNVSGVSTFTSGPVLIGSGTSTGTASQTLQVTGGVYASGNLGIGTINPQERVHFYSPTSTNFIRLDNSSSATSYYGLNSSGDVELNAATNNNLIFKTFGTERGRFNSSGNLGIGTVTPSSLLHLLQSSGNAKITIQRSNTGSNTDDYGSILWRSSAANNNGAIGVARESGEDNGYMYFSTGSGGSLTERLRISSSGNTYNFTNPQFVSYSGSFGGNLGIVAPFTKTVFVNASTTTTIATIDMSSNYTLFGVVQQQLFLQIIQVLGVFILGHINFGVV